MLRTKLFEGVHLTAVHTDRFKSSLVSVNFLGACDERETTVFAMLPAVMKNGCAKYPTIRSLSRRREDLYLPGLALNSSRRGEVSVLNGMISSLNSSHLPDGADISLPCTEFLSDMIFDPLVVDGAFVPETVETERKNLLDRISEAKDNKASLASRRCIELLCQGEPYSIPTTGTAENALKITAAELYEAHQRLTAKSPVEIIYVGDEDDTKVRYLLLPLLEKLMPRECTLPRTVKDFTRRECFEQADDVAAAQSNLVIGMRTDCQDEYALALFNELFGGAPSSRLFTTVREKMSLCYSCSSGADFYKGVVTAACGIDAENFESAKEGVISQLEDLKSGNFTEKEIETAKRSLCNLYLETQDDPVSLAKWYLSRALLSSEDTPEDAARRVSLITRDELIAAGSTITPQVIYLLRGKEPSDD